jgi:hypothetical protein
VPPQQDVERSGALLTVISKRDPERERERVRQREIMGKRETREIKNSVFKLLYFTKKTRSFAD